MGVVFPEDLVSVFLFFFFNDTATTEIYTLSLHDALPIFVTARWNRLPAVFCLTTQFPLDRKSTRLNSSHSSISYAVFCLKKKNTLNTLFFPLIKKKNKKKIHTCNTQQ